MTIVSPLSGVVVDELVMPKRDIIDYCTEFSGISEDILTYTGASVQDVQQMLRRIIDHNTIIIGHSLDSDLKVLHLVHSRNIDTASLFPHPKGLPFKLGLKKLVADLLHKTIQNNSTAGHDSVEDAVFAFRLVLCKMEQMHNKHVPPAHKLLSYCPWQDSFYPRQPFIPSSTELPSFDVSIHSREVPSIRLAQTGDLGAWERFHLGYRVESDPLVAASVFMQRPGTSSFDLSQQQRLLQQSLGSSSSSSSASSAAAASSPVATASYTCNAQAHTTNSDAAQGTVQALDRMSVSSDKRAMLWCDYIFDEAENGEEEGSSSLSNSRNSGRSFGRNKYVESASVSESASNMLQASRMRRLDAVVERVYNAMPEDGCLMVVTQGALDSLRQRASQRLRNKWEYIAFRKRQAIADCSRALWNHEEDGPGLQAATECAMAGTLFIRRKTTKEKRLN